MTEPPISDAILDAMAQYGGSFVQQLVVLYGRADPINQQILATAFAHYVREYALMVELIQKDQRR